MADSPFIRRVKAAIAARDALHTLGVPAPRYGDSDGLLAGRCSPGTFDTGRAHGPTSDPRNVDCGCGWGWLCDASTLDGTPYTLCECQRWARNPHRVVPIDTGKVHGPTREDGQARRDAMLAANRRDSWADTHPSFVTSYMDRDSAQAHAARIGGRVFYVWASGIDTWHVHR